MNRKKQNLFLCIAILCIGIGIGTAYIAYTLTEASAALDEIYKDISPEVTVVRSGHLEYTRFTNGTDSEHIMKINPVVVRPGDTIMISFPTKNLAVNGWWASSKVVFEPKLSDEQIAKGITFNPIIGTGKKKSWDQITGNKGAYGGYVMVIPSTKLKLPKDPMLEGETIEGVLKMNVEFPGYIGTGHYENIHTPIEKPIAIHIFSKDEIKGISLPPFLIPLSCFIWSGVRGGILWAFLWFGPLSIGLLIILLILKQKKKEQMMIAELTEKMNRIDEKLNEYTIMCSEVRLDDTG